MKFLNAVIIVMLCSTMVFAQEAQTESNAGKNLVEVATYWRPQVDAFGSSVDTGSALVKDGVVSAEFTMVKQPSPDQWPYVELMCGLGQNLGSQDTIEISYKSDRPLIVKLVQSDLSEAGNETYAYYEIALHPSPKSWTVTRVLVENFSQPVWAPEEAMFVPLRAENVAEVQLVPEIDEKVGGTGKVSINKLVVFAGPRE